MLCRSIHSLESIELNFIFPPPYSDLFDTLLIIAHITLFGHSHPICHFDLHFGLLS